MNFNSIASTLIVAALNVAKRYYPPAAIVEPLVKGIAAGILENQSVPQNEDVEAYRAAVMEAVNRLLTKIDVIEALASEEKARALADLAAEQDQ